MTTLHPPVGRLHFAGLCAAVWLRPAATDGTGWRKHVIQPSAQGAINGASAGDGDRNGHSEVTSSFDGKVVVCKRSDWRPFFETA